MLTHPLLSFHMTLFGSWFTTNKHMLEKYLGWMSDVLDMVIICVDISAYDTVWEFRLIHPSISHSCYTSLNRKHSLSQ
jgi:hypothetical protein